MANDAENTIFYVCSVRTKAVIATTKKLFGKNESHSVSDGVTTNHTQYSLMQYKIFTDAAIYFQRTGTDFGLLQGMPNLEYNKGCTTQETIEVDHHYGV